MAPMGVPGEYGLYQEGIASVELLGGYGFSGSTRSVWLLSEYQVGMAHV